MFKTTIADEQDNFSIYGTNNPSVTVVAGEDNVSTGLKVSKSNNVYPSLFASALIQQVIEPEAMIIKVNKIVENGDRSVGFGKYTQVNNRYNKALRSDCGYSIWTNGSSISDERMVSQGMSHCSAPNAYYSKGVGNYLTALATDREEDTPCVRVDESYKSTAYNCSNGINRELIEVPTLDSTINKSSPIPTPDSSISKPSPIPTTSITLKSSSTPVSTSTKGYCGFKVVAGKVDDCCSSVMAA